MVDYHLILVKMIPKISRLLPNKRTLIGKLTERVNWDFTHKMKIIYTLSLTNIESWALEVSSIQKIDFSPAEIIRDLKLHFTGLSFKKQTFNRLMDLLAQ